MADPKTTATNTDTGTDTDAAIDRVTGAAGTVGGGVSRTQPQSRQVVRYPECRSVRIGGSDEEGNYDCLDCGLWFHSSQTGVQRGGGRVKTWLERHRSS